MNAGFLILPWSFMPSFVFFSLTRVGVSTVLLCCQLGWLTACEKGELFFCGIQWELCAIENEITHFMCRQTH
ncbi:hypothetical protein IW262DRAFT_1336216 [Armillaria fumosa]|nr:hypothetical protein IW262DRAFT_1336216 [Armillaria fumosa]